MLSFVSWTRNLDLRFVSRLAMSMLLSVREGQRCRAAQDGAADSPLQTEELNADIFLPFTLQTQCDALPLFFAETFLGVT